MSEYPTTTSSSVALPRHQSNNNSATKRTIHQVVVETRPPQTPSLDEISDGVEDELNTTINTHPQTQPMKKYKFDLEINRIDDEDNQDDEIGSEKIEEDEEEQELKPRQSFTQENTTPNVDDIEMEVDNEEDPSIMISEKNDGGNNQDLNNDVAAGQEQETQGNDDGNGLEIPQPIETGHTNHGVLNYFEDFALEMDSSGRVYFEVEICHQTPLVEDEVSFEIGICNSNEELIAMNNCGKVQLNMESVMDMGVGLLKENDVVGVLFSFGKIYFVHNGKRIAHGFDWKDIQNSSGKIVCRNNSQKFCIKNNNFLYSGYRKVSGKDDAPSMKTPFTEVIQKITQLEMDYLVKEKENREMKLFHNNLSARMTLSEEEVSQLSDIDIFNLQSVILQSMTLLNDELKNRK